MVLKKRRASPRGVLKRPRRVYGIGHGTTPQKPKVWAMRRSGWIEFRTSPVRPLRKMSKIMVGEMALISWSMKGGDFLGMLKFGENLKVGERYVHYSKLYPMEIKNGQRVEVPEEMTKMVMEKLGEE